MSINDVPSNLYSPEQDASLLPVYFLNYIDSLPVLVFRVYLY